MTGARSRERPNDAPQEKLRTEVAQDVRRANGLVALDADAQVKWRGLTEKWTLCSLVDNRDKLKVDDVD